VRTNEPQRHKDHEEKSLSGFSGMRGGRMLKCVQRFEANGFFQLRGLGVFVVKNPD
jgi:hypothetical protein